MSYARFPETTLFLTYLPGTTVDSAIEASNSRTGILPDPPGPNQHARYYDDQESIGKLQFLGGFNAFHLFLLLTGGLGRIKDIEVHVADGGFHLTRNSYLILRAATGFPGVPKFETFLKDKHEPLGRFASIITSIAGVFKIRMTSLRIFYDVPRGPIASNRGGTIYLNLRFFEEWRECNPFYALRLSSS